MYRPSAGVDPAVVHWFSCNSKHFLEFIMTNQSKIIISRETPHEIMKIVRFSKLTVDIFRLGEKYPDWDF